MAGILLASCGFDGCSGEAGETTTEAIGQANQTTAGRPAEDIRGIVFNTASKDVTLFDPSTNRVTGNEPTNAVVRWLSNEQFSVPATTRLIQRAAGSLYSRQPDFQHTQLLRNSLVK